MSKLKSNKSAAAALVLAAALTGCASLLPTKVCLRPDEAKTIEYQINGLKKTREAICGKSARWCITDKQISVLEAWVRLPPCEKEKVAVSN